MRANQNMSAAEELDEAIARGVDEKVIDWLRPTDWGDYALERFLEEYEEALWQQEGAYFYVPIIWSVV